ncbi:unnamed protein product [Lasius platythorax]|uniref:Uncharacterized protein n=1 Tax=Lasius platythorax TaxID=488582 RepID=A0AAV2NQH7_9HYME
MKDGEGKNMRRVKMGGLVRDQAEAHLQIMERAESPPAAGTTRQFGKGDEIKLLHENHHFVATKVRIIRSRTAGR